MVWYSNGLVLKWFGTQMVGLSAMYYVLDRPFEYSGGSKTEQVWNLDGPQLFSLGPNHSKTELS